MAQRYFIASGYGNASMCGGYGTAGMAYVWCFRSGRVATRLYGRTRNQGNRHPVQHPTARCLPWAAARAPTGCPGPETCHHGLPVNTTTPNERNPS